MGPKINLGYGNHFLRPQKGHTQILVKKYNPNQIYWKSNRRLRTLPIGQGRLSDFRMAHSCFVKWANLKLVTITWSKSLGNFKREKLTFCHEAISGTAILGHFQHPHCTWFYHRDGLLTVILAKIEIRTRFGRIRTKTSRIRSRKTRIRSSYRSGKGNVRSSPRIVRPPCRAHVRSSTRKSQKG